VISPRLVQITDPSALPDAALFARLHAVGALAPHERARFAVQLRSPELSTRALASLGLRLRAATRALGVALVINDRLDLARALGADGVHLGRRSAAIADARALLGPSAWISVACHDVDDVVRAAAEGADAVTLSPIFASPGKGTPLGVAAIRAARAAAGALSIAIYALGGVDRASAPRCFEAGADGVAAIRADLTFLLDDAAISTLTHGLAT
jgi:thiamine-phosphate pyrophosphorylase